MTNLYTPEHTFSEEFKKPKKRGGFWVVLIFLILVGIAGGALWYANRLKVHSESVVSPISTTKKENIIEKIVNLKTVQNPLTGIMYTPEEASSWKDLRLLGVMINNYTEARPQSGLIDADLVYEIVAEGGITRYLAFFLTNTPQKIGPVRSTREYYLVLVKEMGDAMLMHIGYSPQALEAMQTWPVKSLGLNGGSFWRDQTRLNAGIATEHTAYVNGVSLREAGSNLGWEQPGEYYVYKFKDDNSLGEAAEIKNIKISFWYDGDYSASFKYNPTNNSYLRYVGIDSAGNFIPHLDQESQKQLEVKNVIVQFATESSIDGDDKNRLDYQLVGSGQAIVFIDGKATKSTWSKESRDARTKFYDMNGKEIEFNRGKFWVSIVPDRNIDQVIYN